MPLDEADDHAPATAGAAPPKKKAPRSECAIDTDR